MTSQQYVWYFFTYIHPRWGCFACIIKWTKGLFGLLAWPILPLQWEPMNRLWISFYQSSKVVAVLNVALFLHRNSQFKVSTRPIRQHQSRFCLMLDVHSMDVALDYPGYIQILLNNVFVTKSKWGSHVEKCAKFPRGSTVSKQCKSAESTFERNVKLDNKRWIFIRCAKSINLKGWNISGSNLSMKDKI